MALELKIEVIAADVWARKFQSAAQRASQVMREKMQLALFGLESGIKDKLSGKVLKVRTGRLRSSVTSRIEGTGKNIIGKVGTNFLYAPVHEYGAVITPKRGKYLTFQVDGHWVRVKSVRIPRRPIWEPTLKENQKKYAVFLEPLLRSCLNEARGYLESGKNDFGERYNPFRIRERGL